jgi:mono/diheme cytochrome c family protein
MCLKVYYVRVKRDRYDRGSKMRAGVAVALAVLGVPAALALAQEPDPSAAGRKVYEDRKCATCHMVAGEGNIRFKLDGVGGRLAEDDLRRWLTDADAMERALPTRPAVRMSEWLEGNRRINDADVDALVAYLASLK